VTGLGRHHGASWPGACGCCVAGAPVGMWLGCGGSEWRGAGSWVARRPAPRKGYSRRQAGRCCMPIMSTHAAQMRMLRVAASPHRVDASIRHSSSPSSSPSLAAAAQPRRTSDATPSPQPGGRQLALLGHDLRQLARARQRHRVHVVLCAVPLNMMPEGLVCSGGSSSRPGSASQSASQPASQPAQPASGEDTPSALPAAQQAAAPWVETTSR
jgi:hypothetical protein